MFRQANAKRPLKLPIVTVNQNSKRGYYFCPTETPVPCQVFLCAIDNATMVKGGKNHCLFLFYICIFREKKKIITVQY